MQTRSGDMPYQIYDGKKTSSRNVEKFNSLTYEIYKLVLKEERTNSRNHLSSAQILPKTKLVFIYLALEHMAHWS